MFNVKIAGLTIQIDNKYRYMKYLCKDYITEDAESVFTVSASEDEILAQLHNSESSPDYAESLCIYRNICLKLTDYDGLLVHAAAVAVDGEGYMFLAKSGVGKSTHIGYYPDVFGERAVIVNGDKPIIRKVDNVWRIYGTPYQGKENLGANISVPLKAICFLQRGEKNIISAADPETASELIFHQILMPRDEERITLFFDLLNQLLSEIPCYHLECTKSPEAAITAYEGMS